MPSASRAALVHELLQQRAHSLVIEQGRAAVTRRRNSRTHYLPSDPGWTASSIYSDLICDKDRQQPNDFCPSTPPPTTPSTSSVTSSQRRHTGHSEPRHADVARGDCCGVIAIECWN